MKRYEAVRGLRTTCYRLVPSYSGVWDFFVRFPTASYCDVARCSLAKHYCVVKYSTYQYIPVCTCTYLYVPEHTGSYQNVHCHTSTTSTYQYIPVHVSIYPYTPVHTSTSQYIPVHPISDQGSKKVQTGFEPIIFCTVSPFSRCTESVPISNTEYANFCVCYVNILMFIYLPVYLALDDGSTAPVPAAPPPPPAITDSEPMPAWRQPWTCSMCLWTAAQLRNRQQLERWQV